MGPLDWKEDDRPTEGESCAMQNLIGTIIARDVIVSSSRVKSNDKV